MLWSFLCCCHVAVNVAGADGVVRFEGTEKLLKEATTPAEVPRGKELKEMRGLKHDLLSNATPQMLEAYMDWAGARLEAFSARS